MEVINGLVACSDLTGYARLTGKKSDEEIFRLLANYYEMVGDIVAPASGRVIKFMGDTALMLFPKNVADAGVRALLSLQLEGDRFWAEHRVACRHYIRAHFGPVCFGQIGTRTEKRDDILGSTVNTLFMLKATGFAITPEAFRKLQPETRKLFKKHTPPMTYIPTAQGHRD